MESALRKIRTAVPFNKPSLAGREMEYLRESIESGKVSGDGYFTKKCHELLEKMVGCQKALLTTSCTHALEMAAILLDLKAGDEVIVPSFTFVSGVNAFVLRGATPVFADIREDTLNLDERLLPSLISPRTKAIVPVHYAGVACQMKAIMEIANTNGIAVVEDNAHGLLATYEGQQLGSFGCLATQSFHETKNFHCGEGGALLLNDPTLIERAEIIREKGTNRSRFFQGLVDKYTWVDLGSSYLPSDMLAAFLFAQLESRDTIVEKRKSIWDKYDVALRLWSHKMGIRQPFVPANCEQAYHMYYLIMPTHSSRQRFITHMAERKAMSVYHYIPLHNSPMGIKLANSQNGQMIECPVTEEMSSRLVRLPFYNSLTADDQDSVIESALEFEV